MFTPVTVHASYAVKHVLQRVHTLLMAWVWPGFWH